MTSFPKAKLHRFNDDISCAPPPGTYDPKLEVNVKGASIQKSKRFPDQNCLSGSTSLDNLNKCSHAQMNFRTPQLQRKLIKSTPKLDRQHFFDTPGSSSSTNSRTKDESFKTPGVERRISRKDYKRLEEKLSSLADKHVSEISELKAEIFKLQENLSEVENRETEIKRILKEKSALASERHNQLLAVKQNLDTVEDRIQKERDDNEKYMEELKSEVLLLETKKEDLEGIITEKQSVIIAINERYLKLENDLKLEREENEKYKEEIEFIEEKNTELLNKLVLESETKIERLENSLKTKVGTLEKEVSDAQENSQANFQTTINLMAHEFKSLTDVYENQLKSCFAEVNELKKIVDKNDKEYSKHLQEVDERCRLLYRELCTVEAQRDELVVSDLEKKINLIEIQENSNCIEKDLQLCREKCKKYEITLSTMQKTINALGDRLLESENEVLRLNNVEIELESQKRSLEEKSQLLLTDIVSLRESMGKMEKDIIYDVTVMKENLAEKVDFFKKEAEKKVHLLNKEIQDKQCIIVNLLNELENANGVMDELKRFNINNEKKINYLKNENAKQLDTIDVLKDQIISSKEIVQKKIENEVKQQQYIDGLVSDLVLEKERCQALEEEKDRKLKDLNLKIESMDISFKNLEEKFILTDEDKGLLEMQLMNAESNNLELKQQNEILLKALAESKNKITELQCSFNLANEQVQTSHEFELRISCLEAEKGSLSMQLDEARTKLIDLESIREEKNLIINNLSDQISIEQAKYNDYVSETEKTFETLKRHSELLSINADNGIKLQDAEEKIEKLEEELKILKNKYENSEMLEMEVRQLREDAEVMQLKLQTVTNERNKLDVELAELMGHQNIHQKIKHINQLKQAHIESREKADQLEIENSRLKKKLAEYKENTNPCRIENSPKSKKTNKAKQTSSPAVLKDRNC